MLIDANVRFQSAATRFPLGGARGGLNRAAWTTDIVLVTGNVRDFSAHEAEAGGVAIATSRGFARQLVRRDARATDRLIERVLRSALDATSQR